MRAEPILVIIGIIVLAISTFFFVATDIARQAHKKDKKDNKYLDDNHHESFR